jgi:hypothetical protein
MRLSTHQSRPSIVVLYRIKSITTPRSLVKISPWQSKPSNLLLPLKSVVSIRRPSNRKLVSPLLQTSPSLLSTSLVSLLFNPQPSLTSPPSSRQSLRSSWFVSLNGQTAIMRPARSISYLLVIYSTRRTTATKGLSLVGQSHT